MNESMFNSVLLFAAFLIAVLSIIGGILRFAAKENEHELAIFDDNPQARAARRNLIIRAASSRPGEWA